LALEDLDPLAAGDFRVVRDQFEGQGSVAHSELVAALAEEARLRQQQAGGRTAGFKAS
jgi:hypothetical protein